MNKSGKRPPSMSDTDRVLLRRTPNRGVPQVSIDRELTPPPQEPPAPASTISNYDSIPPPIRESLDLLAQGLGEVTAALGKVWDARKDGEQLERVNSKLASLAEATSGLSSLLHDFVVPAIKDGMRASDEMTGQLPALTQQLATIAALVGTVDNRLRSFETNLGVMTSRFETSTREAEQRYAATEKRLNDHDLRIDALERAERDREVIGKALAKRQDRKAGGIGAVAAAIVTAAAAAIAHFK